MKRFLICIALAHLVIVTIAQMKPGDTEDWSGKPPVVIPGKPGQPPSDAIILFGCMADSVNWVQEDGQPIRWIVDSVLTVAAKSGNIKTVRSFGDCQLHVEWRTPAEISGTSQGRGNSGIKMMGLYEIQVLDSYENETYYNGMAGSIYKQHTPLVNASLGPGEWQTYDIVFGAPRFDANGGLLAPASFTLFHNGVLVQNNVKLTGPTRYIGIPVYTAHAGKLPLLLQDHGNPVSFRNIWIREL
jgi:hypothetical protein